MKRNRKKTLIGSMISSMVGSPTQQRNTFITSLIGEDDPMKEKKSKGKLNPVLIIIPTIFDLSETMCSNIALTMIAASIT